MEALKAEIERKKQLKEQASKNIQKKYIKLGEIEREKHKILEETRKSNPDHKLKKEREDHKHNETIDDDKEESEAKEKEMPSLPKNEVIKRLRLRNEPITFFGETDLEREKRLRQLEVMTPEPDMQTGQRNDFDRAIKETDGELNKSQDSASLPLSSDAPTAVPHDQEDEKDVEPRCKEDICHFTLKRLVKVWERDLNERPEAVKRSASGRVSAATFKQTRRYVRPLFKLLRSRTLPDDMLNLIYEIVENIKKKEYVRANDAYLRMAIGNAPWPIGVTMVGIHERSAREKIFTNQVAHILNDEVTRKYIQSIKRLMTFCQTKYPTDPSKSVG
eukprot:TRINITY_DN1463_c0_g2_i1.p1 TRINITY_DN1463_c0_g2~~TRINITY_DN1463_c0_g2_i1.p1  ORF type:complete len:332 (-),score=71.30 TRINITY_DN1463_c0_g2_i1:277-1272(-)